MSRRTKIVGFAQLHNEREKGNLEHWLRCMSVCDHVYIYDQASTDDSAELYRARDDVTVVWSPTNDFDNEIQCKGRLLDELLRGHPDTDWIFWMDGDTLLDAHLLEDGGEALRMLCEACKVDTLSLAHYNLWRSDVYHRVDSGFAMEAGVPALWRNTGRLRFDPKPGLHHPQTPTGLRTTVKTTFALINRGFATDEQIIEKYERYKARGQTGWELDRLIDETALRVERLPPRVLPGWIDVRDEIDPTTKTRLTDTHAQER